MIDIENSVIVAYKKAQNETFKTGDVVLLGSLGITKNHFEGAKCWGVVVDEDDTCDRRLVCIHGIVEIPSDYHAWHEGQPFKLNSTLKAEVVTNDTVAENGIYVRNGQFFINNNRLK